MRRALALIAALAASPLAAQDTGTPEDLIEALNAGYVVTAVIGQGVGNQDHVIYLSKAGRTIVCAFRVALTDRGFDPARSGPLGRCTGFVGQR